MSNLGQLHSFGTPALNNPDIYFNPAKLGEYYSETSTSFGNREWLTVGQLTRKPVSSGYEVATVDLGSHRTKDQMIGDETKEVSAHLTVKLTFAEYFTNAEIVAMLDDLRCSLLEDTVFDRIKFGAR